MSGGRWEFTGFVRRPGRLLAGFVRAGERRLVPVDGAWTVPTSEAEEPPLDGRQRQELLRLARSFGALARTAHLAREQPIPERRSSAQ